jgi:D-arginine dehydrogenase
MNPPVATLNADLAVVGAGIAGVSLAFFAAASGARVLLLERESQPAMHSTGRSAAMFMESYGTPQVRALTRASRPFLSAPPAGFAEVPLITPRGALYIASNEQLQALRELHTALCAEGCPAQWLNTRQAQALVGVLRPEAAVHAVLDPTAMDLDVHALHQGFLRGARGQGARLVCKAEVLSLQRQQGRWLVDTTAGPFSAACVVNAAGAWVDDLAARAGIPPIGIQPRRRSAFVFDAPPGAASAHWPCVADVGEGFYFKPEAGLLLGSPANADPVPPHDVLPEELDIATGIARIEAATTLSIRRPRRTWAGLRSFVSDGDLVAGYEPGAEGFFWLAAQGGYGIQTCAAMGALAAAELLGQAPPAWVAAALPYRASLAVRRAA